MEEQKQGKPWKKMGRFSSFEEADRKRKQLIKTSNSKKEFQVKVKRAGIAGKQFVVKLRYIS